MDAMQRSIDAQQIILSTAGHVPLDVAASIIDAALDAGRAEAYGLITHMAAIAADALATADPSRWAHRQQQLIIGAQLLQLESGTDWTTEPPC